MQALPVELMSWIVAFAPLFSKPVFEHVKVLLCGALLATGKRTITACLRVMGKADEPHFQNYHRLLNRDRWSALAASRRLLALLVAAFAPTGPLVFGIDDTIERRRGEKITAKGIYRDPVRSSHSHFVKASGLRWLCCMLLVEVSWAARVWALPFLTGLCPSERFYQQRRRAGQTLIERAWQIIQRLRRCRPGRELIFVADSRFAAIELLKQVSDLDSVSLITRLRLDAAWYDEAPVRRPGQVGRPRLKGKRRPALQALAEDAAPAWTALKMANWYGEGERAVEVCTDTAVWYHTGLPPGLIRWLLIRDPEGKFATRALLPTNPAHGSQEMLTWFVRRWTMEVTFEEVRAHLGVETQRQWNDLAMARATPTLFGLYSLVSLMADGLREKTSGWTRQAAW
jgi:DDE superfamily endonuclease